jgi:hypothetical protein
MVRYLFLSTVALMLFSVSVYSQSERAYLVDTITINNAHKVFIRKGKTVINFYCDESIIGDVDKMSLKELINHEMIFFTSIDFYSFFQSAKYSRTFFNDCKDEFEVVESSKNLTIYRRTDNVRYYLCLINIDYFNERQASVDYKKWSNPIGKGAFIKVVFPYCGD